MAIVWKKNGVIVKGPEEIPDSSSGTGVNVRASYKKPIELDSMGFLAYPEDVAEHRRRFPDVELRMKDGSAVPVMRSLGEKRSYLKRAGWVDTRSY